MVLKTDSSLWVTGWNTHGELGDGTKTQRDSFVEVVPSGQCDTVCRRFVHSRSYHGHHHTRRKLRIDPFL